MGCPFQCRVSYSPPDKQQQAYLIMATADFFQNCCILQAGKKKFFPGNFFMLSLQRRKIEGHFDKFTQVFTQSVLFFQSLDKTEYGFIKTSNIQFPASPSNGSRAFPCGQTVLQTCHSHFRRCFANSSNLKQQFTSLKGSCWVQPLFFQGTN